MILFTSKFYLESDWVYWWDILIEHLRYKLEIIIK